MNYLLLLVAVIAVMWGGGGIVLADEEYTEPVFRRETTRFRRQTGNDLQGPFNRTLRIVTVPNEPYIVIAKAGGSSDKYVYSGFIPDLVEALSRRLDFKYEMYNVTQYGRLDSDTNKWTGMIGQIVLNDETGGSQGADIAAADITITAAREQVVNFLKPFQHLGVAAIVRRPEQPSEDQTTSTSQLKFGIFQPIHASVWALILISSLVTALFLWAMNMYNPYEWGNLHELGEADSQQAEMFNLKGSLWFVFTTLQWQGFERSPNSNASRFISFVWFTFVTLVIVTYTAGLVDNFYWASSSNKLQPNSLRHRYIDLAHAISSGDFKYGTIRNSQTYRYIMEVSTANELDPIRRYWRTPEGQEQLVSNVAEGINRTRDPDSNYVFLMESISAQYYANRLPCDLVTIGEKFGMRSYGFAVPTKMPFSWSDELHRAIFELAETGEIESLERRWFADANQCWNTTFLERFASDTQAAMSTSGQQPSVDLVGFSGPLILITVGLVIGVVIFLAEIVYYRRFRRVTSRPQRQQLGIDPQDSHINM